MNRFFSCRKCCCITNEF